MLAGFYGPFQSCPGLNAASCWPHGRNVVPCPSSEEGGGHSWPHAKKVLLRPRAYVAVWRQAAQGETENGFGVSWSLITQNQKPLNIILLKDMKAVPYSSEHPTWGVIIPSVLKYPAYHVVMQISMYVHTHRKKRKVKYVKDKK